MPRPEPVYRYTNRPSKYHKFSRIPNPGLAQPCGLMPLPPRYLDSAYNLLVCCVVEACVLIVHNHLIFGRGMLYLSGWVLGRSPTPGVMNEGVVVAWCGTIVDKTVSYGAIGQHHVFFLHI